ncbi:hypothetical protein RUM44_010523 [Polyplax serrata]|uniref:Uncharacterized protein n=1 Tax=Polyplax serrata TaxID=468196 RepID=A0ABR1AWF0_POLSC
MIITGKVQTRVLNQVNSNKAMANRQVYEVPTKALMRERDQKKTNRQMQNVRGGKPMATSRNKSITKLAKSGLKTVQARIASATDRYRSSFGLTCPWNSDEKS